MSARVNIRLRCSYSRQGTHIANDAAPSQRCYTRPELQLLLHAEGVEIPECDTRLDHDVSELLVDLEDFVHAMEI